MAYKQLRIWGRDQATQASNAQTLRKTVNVSQFSIEKVKVEKMMANNILMAHILSETTRDESTLTYTDNRQNITLLNYSLNISLLAHIG